MFSEQGNKLLLKAWNYVHIHKCVYTDTPMHALRGDFSSFLVLEYNLANTLKKVIFFVFKLFISKHKKDNAIERE